MRILARYLNIFTTFISEVQFPFIMAFIDEKGRFLGMINLVDFAIVLLIFAILSTVLVYHYSPPRVNETENVIFQTYFVSRQYTQPLNKGVAHQFFVEGNEFTATMDGTKAVITHVQFIQYRDNDEEVHALITLNGTLRKGVDGQYLFNGLEISPGKIIHPQINGSYFRGAVHRVNYEYQMEKKTVNIVVPFSDLGLLQRNAEIIDYEGNVVGRVRFVDRTLKTQDGFDGYLAELDLEVDVYDGLIFFEEKPLLQNGLLYVTTKDGIYSGNIIGAS
jgi:hypothetical protein